MNNKNAETALDLECRSLNKTFGDFVAVRDIDFTIPKGTFFSILGPSGCGKTTILRMVAGFLEPTAGDIIIRGRSMLDVPPNKRPVNLVFQHLALFPMMNVADNVAYGLRRRGLPKDQIKTKVADVLDRVGLPEMGSREISQLSGGQKQRIAIARCLVLEPDLLLLDEPLGALDLKLREHMKVELKKLQSLFDTTFIYITHDQSEALVMSDQVAVMNAGAFEQVGAAQDLYYNPETAFVAGFVGDSNRWKGKVTASGRGGVKVETQSGLALVATANNAGEMSKGDTVEIFVRPESVALGRDKKQISAMDNQVEGEVVGVLFNGANSRVLVREAKSGGEIDIALPQTGEFNDLTRGQKIYMGWKHDQAKCFADNGA